MDAFIETQRGASLKSRYSLVSGFSGPLPDDQWQQDVEGWHHSTLAAMQGSAVDAATGPANPAMRQFWVPPANSEQQYLCRNQVRTFPKGLHLGVISNYMMQKVTSSAHTNFDVFGLAFTLVVGSLVILVSIVLEPAVAFYQQHYDNYTYSQLEWVSNGTLQLQRLAQEEHGAGTWSNTTKYVPVCKNEDLLAGLDMRVPNHPRLKPPVSSIITAMSPVSPVSPVSDLEKVDMKAVEASKNTMSSSPDTTLTGNRRQV